MKYRLSISFIFLLCFIAAKSQKNFNLRNNCLPQTIYKTDSIGERDEKLPFKLTIQFSTDSIWVFMGNKLTFNNEFLSFKIEKIESCQWNKDLTIGKTSYQLLMVDKQQTKHPKLNIIYEPSGKKYIEILYENSEERIFTITQ